MATGGDPRGGSTDPYEPYESTTCSVGSCEGLEIHSPGTSAAGSSKEAGRRNSVFSLKWNGFERQVTASLTSLYASEELVDVSLACEDGPLIKAHKVVLAMVSTFFLNIFKENPCKHPIVVLKGLKFQDVQHVMHFIYMGEVKVREEEIDDFIEAAESLRIDGISSTANNISNNRDFLGENGSSRRENPEPLIPIQPAPSWISPNPATDIPEHTPRRRDSYPLLNESESRATTVLRIAGRSPPSATSPLGSFRSNDSDGAAASPLGHLEPVRSRSSEATSTRTLIELNDPLSPPQFHTRTRHLSYLESDVGDRHQNKDMPVAEDLSSRGSASSEHGYELSLPEGPGPLRTGTGPKATYQPYTTEKRSISWPLETGGRPTNYLPLSLVAASAMTSHPQSSPRFNPHPISSMSTPAGPDQLYRHSSQPSSRPLDPRSSSNLTHGPYAHHPYPATSSLSALRQRLSASLTQPFPPSAFGGAYGKYGPPPNPNPGSESSGPIKPKTKAIRSSQVPQSARYTAAEVDAMVDKVDNFPGPLVPCVVCQKFVKRERLRAHIHECHLLHGERIICPHCGIGLKSKGSFRVHIWRHKRGNLSLKPKDPK